MFRLKKNLKVLTNWHANNVNKYSIWNNLLLIYNYRYFEFSRRFWKVRNRTAIITRLYISNNFQSIFTKLYRIIRFIYFREKKIISVILNGMYFFFFLFYSNIWECWISNKKYTSIENIFAYFKYYSKCFVYPLYIKTKFHCIVKYSHRVPMPHVI